MTQFQAARELGIDVPMIRDVLARNLIQSDTREPRWSKSEVSLEPSGEYVALNQVVNTMLVKSNSEGIIK